MSLTNYTTSLANDTPPAELSSALQAMWYERKGDWERAHDLLQHDQSAAGAWVHAYLHRREGDDSNAGYWYRRAGKPFPNQTLDTEWEAIVTELLG